MTTGYTDKRRAHENYNEEKLHYMKTKDED